MVSLANKSSRSRWLTVRGSFWLFSAVFPTTNMAAPASRLFRLLLRKEVCFFSFWNGLFSCSDHTFFVVAVHIDKRINMR